MTDTSPDRETIDVDAIKAVGTTYAEACENVEANLRRLGLHPPSSLVCPHELRHYGDRCPLCD